MKFLGKHLNIIVAIFLILIIAAFIWPSKMQSQRVSDRLYNPQVIGWFWAMDSSMAGQKTWLKDGTADTLYVPNVDTTCAVFLAPKTATGTLRYDVAASGDSVFVTSSGAETGGTDKYSYFIVRNVNNATDD